MAAAHVLDCGGAAATGLADLAINPIPGAVRISKHEDAGVAHLLSGASEPIYGALKIRTFLVREPTTYVLVGMGPARLTCCHGGPSHDQLPN